MTGPGDLRDAVVARLKSQLGPAVSVEPHGGTFSEEELARYGAVCPAVRVAVTGFGRLGRASSGEAIVPVTVAAVCLAKDVQPTGQPKVSRDTAVAALATAVALAADKCQFGLSGVYPPEDMTARNQFSPRADAVGIAIWQVLWTTRIITGSTLDLSIGALSQLYVAGSLYSGTGAPETPDPLAGPVATVVTGSGVAPDAP